MDKFRTTFVIPSSLMTFQQKIKEMPKVYKIYFTRFFKKWANQGLFLFISFFRTKIIHKKLQASAGFKLGSSEINGKHADNLTTTMVQFNSLVAQSTARLLPKPEDPGSNPVIIHLLFVEKTKNKGKYAGNGQFKKIIRQMLLDQLKEIILMDCLGPPDAKGQCNSQL